MASRLPGRVAAATVDRARRFLPSRKLDELNDQRQHIEVELRRKAAGGDVKPLESQIAASATSRRRIRRTLKTPSIAQVRWIGVQCPWQWSQRIFVMSRPYSAAWPKAPRLRIGLRTPAREGQHNRRQDGAHRAAGESRLTSWKCGDLRQRPPQQMGFAVSPVLAAINRYGESREAYFTPACQSYGIHKTISAAFPTGLARADGLRYIYHY